VRREPVQRKPVRVRRGERQQFSLDQRVEDATRKAGNP
jgi:hypothetical protein